jgi:hypothetical protein
MTSPNTRPHVVVAAICESVLTEVDNVLSAIRIIDTITSRPRPEAPPDSTPPFLAHQFWYLLCLRGETTGEHPVRIVLENPKGEPHEFVNQPMSFDSEQDTGGFGGANFALHMNVVLGEPGIYWFRSYWHEELIASSPLRVVIERQATSTGTP